MCYANNNNINNNNYIYITRLLNQHVTMSRHHNPKQYYM